MRVDQAIQRLNAIGRGNSRACRMVLRYYYRHCKGDIKAELPLGLTNEVKYTDPAFGSAIPCR